MSRQHTTPLSIFCSLAAAVCLLAPLPASAQTETTFTYQGRLDFNGHPYSGSADYRFSLWDAAAGGTQVGTNSPANGVSVEAGLFATGIDFGQEAHGASRFLQIEVRTPAWDGLGAEPAFFTFPDRTPMTPAPYALQTRGLFVSEDGTRVGFGTTAPKRRLHNAGDYYGRGHIWLHAIEGDGSSGTAYLQARDDSGTSSIGLQLRSQEAGALHDVMHIAPNGWIGIGRRNPQFPLDINGDIRVDSTNGTFQIGSSSADTVALFARVDMAPGSSIEFPDGTVQATAYRPPIVANVAFGSFNVSNGGQNDIQASNISGAQPGMAVIVTPPYDLWPFHTLGYARVVAPGLVKFRILSTGGGDRTYSAATWRITVIP